MKANPRKRRFLFSLLALAVAGVAAWALFSDRTDDRDAFLGLEAVLSTGTREEIDKTIRRMNGAKRIEDIAGYASPVSSRRTLRVANRILAAAVNRLEEEPDRKVDDLVFAALRGFQYRLHKVECGVELRPTEREFAVLQEAVARLAAGREFPKLSWGVSTNETGGLVVHRSAIVYRAAPSSSSPLPPGRIEVRASIQ